MSQAADVGPTHEPAPYQGATFTAPIYNWSGFYLGGHVGGGWANFNTKDPAGAVFAPPGAGVGASGSGFLGGGQLGFNYQTGPWVFGLEGDFSFTDIRGATISTLVAPNVGISSRLNWVGTVTGRVGVTWDRAMIYAKGGAAFGEVSSSANVPAVGVFDGKQTRAGWTIGAGAEYALWDNWTLKAEYNYLDLGTRTVTETTPAGPPIQADAKVTEHMIKLGANYRFSWR